MVTLKDIAKECGVSVAAVSKALNGSDEISASTKDTIKAAAQKMGYRPNAFARSLKTNRSYNIGVLFDDDTNNGFGHAFFSRIMTALRRHFEQKGYDITFFARNSGGREYSYLNHARQRRLDGVVIACVDYDDPYVLELVGGEVPVCAIDFVSDKCNCVYSDNYNGMYSLTKYCAEQGHRRIAFIHGQQTCITHQRLDGYRAALKEAGLPLLSEYEVEGEYYSIEVCHDRILNLLKLPQPPTCVIISDDYSMFGVQKAAFELGLSVPLNLSVAGFDDIKLAPYFIPALTTVRQDAELIGNTAAKLVLSDIDSRKKGNKNVVIPTEIVVRNSVRKISV